MAAPSFLPRMFLLFVCLGLAGPVPGRLAADTEAISLRALMSPSAFERAGLDKLSERELEFLSRWHAGLVDEAREEAVQATVSAVDLERKAGGEKPLLPKGDDAFGFEHLTGRVAKIFKSDRKIIKTSIGGSFRGWRGDTVFRLENGQVWKQVDDDEFYVRETDPEVTIKRGMFGTYFLSIKGYGSRAKVERIR